MRPDLGMGNLRSPDSKKSAKSAAKPKSSSTFRVESKDETYTVSSAETTLQEEKSEPGAGRSDLNDNLDEGELEAKMSAFAGLDVNSLRELVSKASSNLSGDPAFYLKLVSDLTSKTQR